MGEWVVDDNFILNTINLEPDSTFENLIDEVCHHVYSNIKLDSIFNIEKWMETLLQSEAFLAITKKRHRDHLLHACRIAILGEKLLNTTVRYNNLDLKFIDIVRELMMSNKLVEDRFVLYGVDLDNKNLVNENILQIWYISALFHDIGYVYESFLEAWKNINFLMNYPNFRDLFFDIESAMTRFKRDFRISNIYPERAAYNFSRNCDHGEIGACLISNLVGESNLLCDIASTVADSHTSSEIIKFESDPLSFLMILLDEVQDWCRPTVSKKMRQQILAEELRKGSPFLQNNEIDPELKAMEVQYNFSSDEEPLNLKLGFIFDFGANNTIITNKDFSYPWYLYSKYKNLQRLQIGNISKVSEKLFNSHHEINFNVFLEFKATSPLLTGLNRQCNILYFKTLLENNNILCDWTKNYREKPQVKFEISGTQSLPKILNGDYDDILKNAHLAYLIDKSIKETLNEFNFKYDKDPDSHSIYWTTTVRRIITSCKKGVPIEGIYASFDQVYTSYNVEEVIVNGIDITHKIKSTLVEGSENPVYNVRFAMYIPFETVLYYPQKYDVSYKVKFVIPFDPNEPSHRMDTITNIKNESCDNVKLTVAWDKELFNKWFKSAIMFRSNREQNSTIILREVLFCESEKSDAFIEYLKVSCKNCYRGHAQKNEIEGEGHYIFEFPKSSDLEPLTTLGFIWTHLK